MNEVTARLLNDAATESLERIGRDHAKAPPRVRPLLYCMRENLFDPQLDLNYLRRKVGVRDHSVVLEFHSAVGRPPYGYPEIRRLETASRLLIDTDLKIWKISEMVGYASLGAFSRAFERTFGRRPSVYRREMRSPGAKVRSLSVRRLARAAGLSDAALLRRAIRGELDAEQAEKLISWLLDVYRANGAAAR